MRTIDKISCGFHGITGSPATAPIWALAATYLLLSGKAVLVKFGIVLFTVLIASIGNTLALVIRHKHNVFE